jgi:Tol biopolymer transport system component
MRFGRWIGLAAVVVAVATTAAAGNASPVAQFLVETLGLPTGHVRLAVIAANGTVVRVLSSEVGPWGRPIVSPDSQVVAFDDSKGLVVEGIDGSSRRLLVRFHRSCRRSICVAPTSWSPDGTKLFVTDLGVHKGQYRTWLSLVSVSTGRSHRLVGPRYENRYVALAWSGPANKIAYLAGISYRPRLVIADSTGKSPHTVCSVTCGDPQNDPEIAWSPDGQWLAYTTLNFHVEVLDVATGTTTDVRNAGFPVWAPDSSQFAESSLDGVNFYSPTGDVVETTSVTGAYLLAYGTDGVYFHTDAAGATLQVIPTGQATAQTVFSLPQYEGILSVQPLG